MNIRIPEKRFKEFGVLEPEEFNSFNMSYEDFKNTIETNDVVTVENRLMKMEIRKQIKVNPFGDPFEEEDPDVPKLYITKVVKVNRNCNLDLDIRICNTVLGINWGGYTRHNSIGDDFMLYNNVYDNFKERIVCLENLYETLMVIGYVVDEIIHNRKPLNNITVLVNNYNLNKVFVYNKGMKGCCSFRTAKRIMYHLRNDEYLFVFNSESHLNSTGVKLREVINDEGQKISLEYIAR